MVKHSFVVLLLLCSLCFAQQKTCLWKVTTASDPLYLLGSIHVGRQSLYPMPSPIEKAFKESGTVAVEVNITDVDEEGAYAFVDAAMYPRGDTLQKHISKDTYNLIMKEFERYGVDTYRMQRVRPWALAFAVSGLESQKANVSAEYGIDLHFINRATFLKKRIVQLETMQLQANVFAGLTDRQQELFLVDTIKHLSGEAASASRLLQAWREGDTKTLEQSASQFANPEYAVLYERILTTRNKGMLIKIEELIQEPGTEMVIVGAAHLVGKDGLVEMLKKKGYSVEQQ